MIDASPWVGTPYAETNCAELAVVVARTRGYPMPDLHVTSESPEPTDEFWRWWDVVEGDPQVGDVLIVSGNPRGVATVIDDRNVLTTTPDTNGFIMRRNVFLRARLIGVYRPRRDPVTE